jgi:hypothetical protein
MSTYGRLLVGAFLVTAAGASSGRAADADAKGIEFFEAKIRPVLVNNCYECHSEKAAKLRGGLLLDSREGVRKGGDTGPAIDPGNPDNSLLIKALRHDTLKMPPKDKLTDGVVADFVQWVRMGAPDPRDAGAKAYKRMTLEEARDFWSLKPVADPRPPKVKDAGWAKDDLDRFLLAKLQAKGLKPVADADRHTLVRRVYFDLIGLPPTPEEVEAFVKEYAAKPQAALEALVDRLLASPHFGERWGRHWLDLARYAESNGNADNTPFPHAWRYRDYVIAAFNQDKPYDQFVREQVAGDLLPSKDAKEKDELLTATGFLALTSKPRAQNNPDYRFDLIADQIDVTSRAVLGLSVMCARCHDHKFDPISTKEYYSLAGIFDSTQMLAGVGGRGAGKNAGPGALHALSDDGQAMGVREGRPTDTAICIRGDSTKRGETPQRGFLAVATAGEAPKVNRSQSGRLELAQWLTTPENPLTARVAVNRVWLHLFGQGLVKSPDNFGSLGEKPSHPELLDHLARRFTRDGWSTKKLIRAVMLSRAYQMASSHEAKNYQADPDNVLVWRMNRRRLEAEPLRDAVLAVGGKLDRTPPKGTLAQALNNRKVTVAAKETNVRSVYLGIVRGAPLNELLTMFDVASPNLVVAQREVTTVPAQSLFLMNSPWVVAMAGRFAERLTSAQGLDDAARVDLAYRTALARPATAVEKAKALDYVQQTGGDKAWASFCQALFASAEFRYVQ